MSSQDAAPGASVEVNVNPTSIFQLIEKLGEGCVEACGAFIAPCAHPNKSTHLTLPTPTPAPTARCTTRWTVGRATLSR